MAINMYLRSIVEPSPLRLLLKLPCLPLCDFLSYIYLLASTISVVNQMELAKTMIYANEHDFIWSESVINKASLFVRFGHKSSNLASACL